MTEAELQALCKEWQDVLRLRDWDVQAELVRYWEIPDKKGETAFLSNNQRWAKVRLRVHDDTPTADNFAPTDLEQVLVHELLHVKFHDCERDIEELYGRDLHRVVEELADALVMLKRRTP